MNSLAYSPDGSRIISGGEDGKNAGKSGDRDGYDGADAFVLDVPTGKEIYSFWGHVKGVQSVAFLPGRAAGCFPAGPMEPCGCGSCRSKNIPKVWGSSPWGLVILFETLQEKKMSSATAQFVCPVCEQPWPSPPRANNPVLIARRRRTGETSLGAIDFVRNRWKEMNQQGSLSATQFQALSDLYATEKRADMVAAARAGQVPSKDAGMPPRDSCWDCKKVVNPAQDMCPSCGVPVRSGKVRTLRYLRRLFPEGSA